MSQLSKGALRLFLVLLTFVLAIAAFTVVKNQGWLTAFSIESSSRDSQVIHAIERTQEVSLLSLGIQGIREEDQRGSVLGWEVPLTGKTLFMQYSFDAKLGLDGQQVEVTRTGENSYQVSIPRFGFIGYDNLDFKVAVEDGSALSWATPDIDQAELITEILNDEARETYVSKNEDLLRGQAELFYSTLISSVVPDAQTEFEFRS